MQKHKILHGIASVEGQFAALREELKKEYGSDDINIQTGVINYKTNEQTNKKD